jgi:hypothetical protein
MIVKKVEIPSSIGNLEAQISVPESSGVFKPLGVVICHPHPQYGGTMANNVVRSIFNYFGKAGHPTIRFNFRGVGYSAGKFDGGKGEQEDTLAACQFLQKNCVHLMENLPLLIIGYSFGAAVGCALINKSESIHGYVAISYPFTFIPEFITHAITTKPKLFLMGSRDDFTAVADFEKVYSKFPEPKSKQIWSNIDHFWIGSEDLIIQAIALWIYEQTLLSS